MKIKVCGITSLEQLQQLQLLGLDYAGMIFYEKSKRYAADKLSQHQEAIKALTIKRVGVFVNEEMSIVEKAIECYGLNAVQLHGDETDEYCLELMDKAEVIKVFRIGEQQEIDTLVAPFHEVCHYYLFDTDTAAYGGSGKQFNWEMLQKATINKSFFLSGGIGLDDVEKVKAFSHPYFYAVDVNSRFETSPGVKDIESVNQMVERINN